MWAKSNLTNEQQYSETTYLNLMNAIKHVYAGVVRYPLPGAFGANLPAEQPKNKKPTQAREASLKEADESGDRLWKPTSTEALSPEPA